MFWTDDKGHLKSQIYTPLCVTVSQMECGNTHFRSYVYTGFKLGKSAIQLTEELGAVFGVESAPCLRTVQLWIEAIKDGSFSFQKNVISGCP